MRNSLDRSYRDRHLSASLKAESETDNFTRFSMGLAVKRPKSLAVRRKNWQILTSSRKKKLTVEKKSSGDNNGMM